MVEDKDFKLYPEDIKFLKLIREINYGKIEKLNIVNGRVSLVEEEKSKDPKIIKTHKI